MTQCMQAWVILAAVLLKACVCFRYRVFSAGTHLVQRTCFFVHVCDGPASPSGVVSVSLLLFPTELCPV